MKNITILGSGAWGTALGQALSKTHNITIWGRNADKINHYTSTHTHHHLPHIKINPNIKWVSDITWACNKADILIFSIPTQEIRNVLIHIKHLISDTIPLIQTAKGIEITTGQLVHQITKDVLPQNPLFILSGPGFAIDVAASKPTALSLAGTNEKMLAKIQKLFVNTSIRPYAHHDMIGVALGGALKNILAIAAGFCIGHNLGEGAKAAIITRGFNEIIQPSVKIGAETKTLYGLSGLGDLMLTANSPLSRNYQFGYLLGHNSNKLDLNQTTEGYYTLLALENIITITPKNYPIFSALIDLIKHHKPINKVIQNLFERPLKEEF